MELIDKDSLVSEIESKRKYAQTLGDNAINSSMQQFYDGMKQSCVDILSFIDTLEVKEVDLEKYYHDFLQKEWFGNSHVRTVSEMMAFTAKHFFELGLQVRTDKELVEEIYSHIDSIKDTADRMTSGNFMHHRAAIKFSANTIAKVLELMGLKVQKGEEV